MLNLLISTDCTLTLTGLQDTITSSYANAATVTANVKDRSGTVVAGPLTMTYVAASNGNYRCTIPHTASLTLDSWYVIEITATSSGIQLFLKEEAQASYAD